MKRMLLVSLFLMLISSFAVSQTWEVVKGESMNYLPDAVFFLDANTGWMVENDGKVIKTEDGGVTWTTLRESDGSSIDWYDLEFVNSSVGYATAEDGYIFKTTDGGVTWTMIGDTANYTVDINDLAAVSEDLVYFAGDDGTLLKTTDGGSTFTKSDSTFLGEDLDGGIAFCDANVGVVISDANAGHTWYTHDGGASWNYVNVAGLFPVGTTSQRLYDVAAAGDSTIAIAAYHYCTFLSTNGGRSYQLVGDFTYGYKQAKTVDFVDANTLYVGGSDGRLVRTVDGGATWDTLIVGSGQSFKKIDFVDANNGFAILYSEQWYKTEDGGETWTPLLEWPGVSFWGLALPSDNKIVLTAFGGGEIAMSEDGGVTWDYPNNVASGTPNNLYECEFIDENTGIIAGSYGTMSKTVDGGMTWTHVDNPYDDLSNKHFNSLHYWDADTLFAGGSSGYIFRSTDGGATWEGDAYGSKTVYDIWPFSGNKVIASESSGQIWHSVATADTFYFEMFNDYGSMSMRAVEFHNGVGIVVSSSGHLYRTTEAEWDTLVEVFTQSDGNDLYDVEFVNDSLVFVVGEGGTILKSTDAGLTWTEEVSPVEYTLQKVRHRGYKVWAVGQHGNIIVYDMTPQPITVAEARVDADGDFVPDLLGETVAIQAVVTTPNFNSGSSNFFLQDATGGINLYTGAFDLNLNIGDEVFVIGTIEQYKGLTEISPQSESDVTLVSTGNTVEPIVVTLGEISEDYEAMLVEVDSVYLVEPASWPAEGSNGYNIEVTDGADTLVIFVDKETDLDGWTPPEELFNIVAVIDQYTSSTPPDDGYELRPRSTADITEISGITDKNELIPDKFKVYQNFPNPFNPSTNIRFALSENSLVSVIVYDLSGKEVIRLLDNEPMTPGYHQMIWNGRDRSGHVVSSGIYLYRVKTEKAQETHRMVFLK